ncbi:hypothetical protein [Flavobacterium sp.]|uniref:hypothetical protein n=1 Tax=Flavobacterium sp. TaxID=239 RepID=UPI002FDD8F28
MKRVLNLASILLLSTLVGFAQTGKPLVWKPKVSSDNVVMTWNKNTPEQEMKDDIKALSEYGVTIKYANVKRNSANEIIAIDVSFEDKTGHKGTLSYNNTKPISVIKFYKQGEEVGFGEPENSFGGNPFANGMSDNDFLKQFNFNFNDGEAPGEHFKFDFPGDALGKSGSKIIIKKDGKKPLVIENGEVTEGGDDYSQEEIEEIKKNNKIKNFNHDDIYHFNFNGPDGLAEQMKKMQQQLDELMKQKDSKDDKDADEKALEDSKKELEKAKEELENAKKELQKAKSNLKTQKT